MFHILYQCLSLCLPPELCFECGCACSFWVIDLFDEVSYVVFFEDSCGKIGAAGDGYLSAFEADVSLVFRSSVPEVSYDFFSYLFMVVYFVC